MYIKNPYVKQVYRLLFLFACEAGLVLQYASVAALGGAKMLTCYYTILSNMVCFLYFAYLVAARPRRENALVKGAVTMCITVTGLVYHFMLNGSMEAGVGDVTLPMTVANYFVHYIVPIMVVLDYFLFTPKGYYKSLHPLAWLALPYTYLAFALIRAEVSTATFSGFGGASRYPYPFMDVDLLGWNKVVLIIVVVTAAFTALGYLAFVLDHLLGRKNKKKN